MKQMATNFFSLHLDTCDGGFTSEMACEITLSGLMTMYLSDIDDIGSSTSDMTNGIETAMMSESITLIHPSIMLIIFLKEDREREVDEITNVLRNGEWGVIAAALGVFILVGITGTYVYKQKADDDSVSDQSSYGEETITRTRETF